MRPSQRVTELPDSPVRILGLDPGSRHTGFGIVDKAGSTLSVVRFGRFSPPASADLANRLGELAQQLDHLLEEIDPCQAALETAFKGRSSKSLIVLAQARGVLLAGLARHGVPVREYAPTEVKSAVSGYGRADKNQVEQMVRHILELRDQTISEDAADALAVAICCAHRSRLDELALRR